MPVLTGEKEIGKNTNIGYFSQHQVDDLDLSISAFQHIQKLDITKDEKQIRNYLGSFNFKGEKVLDQVNLFSGGEKARLAFAIIAYKKPNLLIMDEPTNHLDIEMRHALTVAIQNFEGAILLVSHDRYLLNSSVDFFYIVRDSSVKIFDGDLEDYRNYVLDKVSIKKTSDSQESHPSQTNVLNEKIRSIKKEIKQLEKRLERLNVKLKDANEKLADPSLYEGAVNDNLQDLIRNQHELTSELKESETLWLEKVQELEEVL
jgi:ATP-binding cassette subfamily F protein 3